MTFRAWWPPLYLGFVAGPLFLSMSGTAGLIAGGACIAIAALMAMVNIIDRR